MVKEAKGLFTDIVRQSQSAAPVKLYKPAPEGEDQAAVPTDPRHYEAVKVATRPPRLDMVPAAGPGHSPSYIALVDVVIDERHPVICTLIYNFLIVIITGRNLKPMADAIKAHKADRIKGYDAQAFDAPDPGAAVIERMEFRYGQAVESMVEMISQAAG